MKKGGANRIRFFKKEIKKNFILLQMKRKIEESRRGEKTRGGSRNETEEVTESDFQSADIFPLPFRNLTVEEKVEPGPDADLGEKPEKRGFSYRKRTKQEEDYDYFYEYETGDYFWKRKSVRVVLPKGKSGNGSRAGSTEFSTVSPEESERKLDTRFGSDFPATKIPDSETSLLFDPVEFDEKYFSCPGKKVLKNENSAEGFVF